MKLRTALEIYRREGPDTSTGQAVTGGAPLATKVVHLHLTAEEIRTLTKHWQKRETERGLFLQALTAAEQRLQNGGYL